MGNRLENRVKKLEKEIVVSETRIVFGKNYFYGDQDDWYETTEPFDPSKGLDDFYREVEEEKEKVCQI